MKTKRFYSLDILKFISAIIIFFRHFQEGTGATFGVINFVKINNFSTANIVELFFTVSGFLCIYSFNNDQSFNKYLTNKLKRIYPMAILSIVCIYLVEVYNYLVFGRALKTDGLGIWTLFIDLTLIFGMGVENNRIIGINNPLWYCGALIICYVVFYVLIKIIKNKKFSYVYIIACLLFLELNGLETSLPFYDKNIRRGLMSFFVGVIVYFIYEYLKDKKVYKQITLLSIIAIIGIFVLGKINYEIFIDNINGILVFIVYPLLMISVLYFDKYINCNKLSLLGNMSFYIYVWHMFFIKLLQTLIRHGLFANMIDLKFMIIYATLSIIVIYFTVYKLDICIGKRIKKAFNSDNID